MKSTHSFVSLAIGAALAATGLALVAVAAEQAPRPGIQGRPETGSESTESAQKAGDFRKREGATFTAIGSVQFTGERITFVSVDGKERLVMLENLALDRVARTVRDASFKTRWEVFGHITEFQGNNYLLLSRAVLVHRDESLRP